MFYVDMQKLLFLNYKYTHTFNFFNTHVHEKNKILYARSKLWNYNFLIFISEFNLK